MSVSSHLNPEPERRLWIIHEKLRLAADRTDFKLAALAVFAALELVLLKGGPRCGAGYAAILLLCAVIPLCLFAFSPFIEAEGPVRALDGRAKPQPGDSLITARDLARYPQMELVTLLDRYLGGGITATRYYEEIVAQILMHARVTSRKSRFFLIACAVALAAQLPLIAAFAAR